MDVVSELHDQIHVCVFLQVQSAAADPHRRSQLQNEANNKKGATPNHQDLHERPINPQIRISTAN